MSKPHTPKDSSHHSPQPSPPQSHLPQSQKSLQKPPIEEICDFLCAYSSALLQSGAYTARVIKCTNRIGQSFGYEVHLSVFLQYITINIADKKNYNNRRTQVIKNMHLGMDLSLISNLSALSWQIYDENISLQEAKEHFSYICAKKSRSLVLGALLIPLGNATFCKLFDGDFGALLCIFVGTFMGFFMRNFFNKIRLDNRAQLLFASFIVSFVAYIGVWLGLSKTPGVAIGGSILYLIPGALILNAFVDIIHENTLMGISRLINMMVLMMCIAAGVYLTLAITNASVL
ncbi:threonine/serine exporter ThrE family protein [Helicobacter canis]|uniref:Inner membrane protein YjjP n=1 Tax=Helicobacter canis TaxID=29419 RepID=A0A377J4R7_9HELI|nr:threonine/serine exporter family protein [Helicobacter canis]STO96803.1 Inner membrane protein YjjP [Helicobacter canis]